MAESILINKNLPKQEKYQQLFPQIKALIARESDLLANLGNICAALKYTLDHFFWVGFYLRQGNELVLGPFQGPVACTRIKIPHGVCGAAAEQKQTIIVSDVAQFPGHIACSSDSKSEIVVPLINSNNVVGVLDIDSETYNNFNEIDRDHLEQLVQLIQWSN